MINMSGPEADWLASMCEDAVSLAIEDALADLPSVEPEFAAQLRHRLRTGTTSAVTDVLAKMARPEILLQRIELIEGGVAIGYEALARFGRTINSAQFFEKASEFGLGIDLELSALRAAVDRLGEMPVRAFLGLNLSAEALADRGVGEVLDQLDLSRVVLELTQQSEILDVQELRRLVDALQQRGAVVAVDGAGVGFFQAPRVVELQPEMIKISSDYVAGCDTCEVKRGELAELIAVGRRIGALVVATGVERDEERDVVASMGVDAVQGYLIGRPVSDVQLDSIPAAARV